MVPKLASKAASLVNGLDSEGHFLTTFDNSAQPLRSLSKQQESQQGRVRQDRQSAYQQEELHSPHQLQREEPNHHLSPSALSIAPQNGSTRHNPLKQDSIFTENHLRELESHTSKHPHENSSQVSQGTEGVHVETPVVAGAEQTCPLSWRLEIQESENMILPKQDAGRPPHGTSSSPSLSPSMGMEAASSISESVSGSKSSSPKLTPRQRSLRGAQKKLSDSGTNTTATFLPASASQLSKSINAPSRLNRSLDKTTLTPPNEGIILSEAAPAGYSGSEPTQNLFQKGRQIHFDDKLAATSPSSLKLDQGISGATLSKSSSITLERDQVSGLDQLCPWQSKEDDGDYMENSSRSYKRRAKSPQESAAPGKISGGVAKRTRSSNTITMKKSLVQSPGKTDQNLTRKAKRGSIGTQEEKSHYVPKGLFSVTGDEYALKHPQKPNAPGIFKNLLDNVDRMNPKSFALPEEIRTFFKGVEANSDGEYVETLDYKPAGALGSVAEDPLQIRDGHGEIRICFHCGKSAYGGRMMISCEHCPLHWHLDCLTPPMASRPPTTRKWMCPNHADHILPRYRKRRDALPVVVENTSEPNDGDIEVIEEKDDGFNFESRAPRIRSLLLHNMDGGVYRVPEKNIQLGFFEKCQRLKQGSIQDPLMSSRSNSPEGEGGREESQGGSLRNLEMLAAAVIAYEGIEDRKKKEEEEEEREETKNRSYEE
ncbi:hypothetical protein BGX27_004102, partial [Mortierella sp. AM989]